METTKRQRDCLEAIQVIAEGQGRPPTLNEICCYVQVSSRSTVKRHVDNLRVMGLVNWEDGRQRTIRLTQQGLELLGVTA